MQAASTASSPKKMNKTPDQELYDAFQMLRLRRIGAEVLSRHPLRAEATFGIFLYGSDERAEIEILKSGYIPHTIRHDTVVSFCPPVLLRIVVS